MRRYFFASSSSFSSLYGKTESKSVVYENQDGKEKGFISETKNGETVETTFNGKDTYA